MPHRSDEEALRAKLDERDRELAEAQRGQEAAERRLREAEAEAERLRRGRPAAAASSGPRAARQNQIALVFSLFLLLAGGLAIGLVVTLSRAPAPVSLSAKPPAPLRADSRSRGPVGSSPAALPVPPSPPIVVHLPARATAVSGDTPVRAGDACSLVATISAGPVLGLEDLVIECSGTRLYGFRDEIFGVSMSELDALAWPGETPGTLRYEITLSDTGARSGRPEAVVRSWSGEGAVYRTGLGAFRVDLDVDPVSEAVPEPVGSAAHYVSALPAHEIRHGHVVSAVPDGLAAGTSCRVAVRPSPGPPTLNTRTHVRCGTTTLYGAGSGGLAPRVGDVITDVGVTSEDGDPAITLDLAAGTVRIHDVRGTADEAVEIALDPVPAAPVPASPALPASPASPAAPSGPANGPPPAP